MIFSKIRRVRVKDSPRGRGDREQRAGRRKVSGNGTIFNLAADMRSVGRAGGGGRRGAGRQKGPIQTNPLSPSATPPNTRTKQAAKQPCKSFSVRHKENNGDGIGGRATRQATEFLKAEEGRRS